MFQYTGIVISDIGLRRSSNQDSYLFNDAMGLYVVADGMGGHSGGETASRIAIETLQRFYEERSAQPPSQDPVEEVELLRQAVEAANRAIYEHAQVHTELRGMGTTFVGLRVRGQTGYVAHVGDSRLYRVDGTALRRVTKDHSRVQELIDAKQLTETEAQSILGRNIITRALGNRPHVEVDTQILDLRPDEGYLLCSDGLCGVLNDDETFAVLKAVRPAEPKAIVTQLIERVKQNGAPDNVTVILLLGNRYGEAKPKSGTDLDRFDLYPDTQKVLSLDEQTAAEEADEEPKEETKPVVLAHAEARPAAADPGAGVLSRGSAETMAHLETLVQSVAASRGAPASGGNGSPGAEAAARPGDQDATQKLSLGEIQQARASTAAKDPEDESTEKLARPAALQAPELHPPAPVKRRRSGVLILGFVGLLLVAGAGFMLFGPTRSQFLVAEANPAKNSVRVRQVGLPVGADLGRSLLEGPLGGVLMGARSSGFQELTLPEAVPVEVWSGLRDCPECAALGTGDRLVTLADDPVESFAPRLYSSLGDHFRDQKLHDKARLFYSAGDKATGASDLKLHLARDYYIEGIELQQDKQFDKALADYQNALDLGGVEADLKERLAAVAFEQGKALLGNGKTREGIEALRIAKKHGFPLPPDIEQILQKAPALEATPAPKEEVAPPPLPELGPGPKTEEETSPDKSAPTAQPGKTQGAGEKEELDDPFREKPASETGKPPRKPGTHAPTPIVEYENQPTPGRSGSHQP
jgi:PPM family protein phosphatase